MSDKNTNITTTASPEKEAVSSDLPNGAELKGEPIATLLGSISYSNEEDWQKFLDEMTIHHSVVVMIAGVNYAQKRGAYNLAEAELLAKAIKTLTRAQLEKASELKGQDSLEKE